MFRIAPQLIARPAARRAVTRSFVIPSRRLVSTAPPSQKSRSWKSLGARLGVAGALIYYYNTTDVFAAEEQNVAVQVLPVTDVESEYLPTIESMSSERRKRKAVQAQLEAQKQSQLEAAAQPKQQDAPAARAKGGMEGLEEEADQQSAFNPETGEINWDCPCLGGMAHGPCGEEFKAAFSCFVYSTEEPKGMDCIDRFKNMQTCFREYPEVYGSELDSDADDEDDMTAKPVAVQEDTAAPSSPSASSATSESSTSSESRAPSKSSASSESPAPSSSSPSSSKSSEAESTPPSSPPSTDGKTAEQSESRPQRPERRVSLVPDNYRAEAKDTDGPSPHPQPHEKKNGLVPDNYKPEPKGIVN